MMRKSGKDGRLCQKCDEVNIQGVDRLTVQSYSGPRSGASRLVLTLTLQENSSPASGLRERS